MKKKSILLCLVLCLATVFGVLGLTGCGETSIVAVQASFKNLEKRYEDFKDVFVTEKHEGVVDGGLQYGLTVKLGENILAQEEDGYAVLSSTYKEILEISNDYVLSNKEYFDGLTDKQLSKNSQNALKNVNDALGSYISEIPTFVSKMKDFDKKLGILEDENGTILPENKESERLLLLTFKKEYGILVSKNINLASAIANFVESTGVFNVIKENAPGKNNFITLKNYIRIKLLPIFSVYRLDRIENVYNFSSTMADQGDAYEKVNNQLKKLDDLFGTFKAKLLNSKVKDIGEDVEANTKLFNQIFEKANKFFTAEANYLSALHDIDFHALSEMDYSTEKYSAKNGKFKREMEIIDIFLGSNEAQNSGMLMSFTSSVCADFGIN